MNLTQEERLKIDSLKGALMPSLTNIPIEPKLLGLALKELSESYLQKEIHNDK